MKREVKYIGSLFQKKTSLHFQLYFNLVLQLIFLRIIILTSLHVYDTYITHYIVSEMTTFTNLFRGLS